MNGGDFEHMTTGEPQPEVRLDISDTHEFRRRVLARVLTRQIAYLMPHRPNIKPQSMTEAELIEAVRINDEIEALKPITDAKREGIKEAYDEILDMIDDMEDEAPRQSGS